MHFSTPNDKPQFDEGEQAAMADAKNMLDSIDESIVDIKNIAEWKPIVMDSKIPVVLDCYADWCNPCRDLTPILEKKTLESDGKFKLVKVNIDLLPEIANGLSVRSIPAVFLISGGNVMDTFVGVPNEERLNDFINTAKLLEQLSHDEKTIDEVIKAAEDQIQNKDFQNASEVFRQSLATANCTEEQENKIYLNLALCYIEMGDELQGKEWYAKWQAKFKNHKLDDDLSQIQDRYQEAIEELRAKEGEDEKLNELLKQLKQLEGSEAVDDFNDRALPVLYDISEHLISKDKHEDAIDYLIDILAVDRNWNNSAPHKLLLEVFNKLGTNNELVKQGRKKLTRVLF